jgi:Flp pilus assembly protein TadG
MPLLMLLLLGTVAFGVAFNQYLQLTGATSTGTRQLAISRGETTDPCNTAVTAIEAAAPTLSASKFTFAFVLNTTSYSGTSCSGAQTNLLAGQNIEVTVTYPCNVSFFNFRPTSGCTLRSQTQARVQ